jgi:hypothetical protein
MKNIEKNTNDSIELPTRIGEYILRQMHLDSYVVIEYSKEAVMMRHIAPNSISKDRVKRNLLLDVKEHSLDKAINKMKEKLDGLPSNLREQFVFSDT